VSKSRTDLLIDRMACDVADVVAARGVCTQADLRRKGWKQAEIDRHGEAATARYAGWQRSKMAA